MSQESTSVFQRSKFWFQQAMDASSAYKTHGDRRNARKKLDQYEKDVSMGCAVCNVVIFEGSWNHHVRLSSHRLKCKLRKITSEECKLYVPSD
jgi:hypothetical protein